MADRGLAYMTANADTIKNVSELSQRDYRWLQRSVGVALTSSHQFRMGALAMKGGQLRGYATNRLRNHPRIVEDWYDCSTHAEQSLIETCDTRSSIVYVARVTPGGSVALAKPCQSCLRSLTEAGVKRVVWTEDDNAVGMLSLG